MIITLNCSPWSSDLSQFSVKLTEHCTDLQSSPERLQHPLVVWLGFFFFLKSTKSDSQCLNMQDKLSRKIIKNKREDRDIFKTSSPRRSAITRITRSNREEPRVPQGQNSVEITQTQKDSEDQPQQLWRWHRKLRLVQRGRRSTERQSDGVAEEIFVFWCWVRPHVHSVRDEKGTDGLSPRSASTVAEDHLSPAVIT